MMKILKHHHFAMKSLSTSLLLAAGLIYGLPVLAQNNAPQEGVNVGKMSIMRKIVPSGALEGQAAQQYMQTMQTAQQKRELAPDNHPQVIRLRAIAKKMIPFALPWNPRAKEWKWEVNLIASTQINAYCMPGGKIAFYTGILDTLKLTDDEVAMIMGHEIAHALREHGAERAGKSMAMSGAAKLLGIFAESKGYDGNMVAGIAGTAGNVAMLKFSREDETEGDIVGMDLAARSGFDPRAGVTLWQKMGLVNQKAPPKWLSTHPAGEDRIKEIRKHFPEVMPLYARAKGVSLANLPPYRSNVKGIPDVQ
ncbi:M48 family metallopeptidase [Undibacterium baiyunense]|nr:M48 family metallopeptidase [Undibacterium baiyunense]